MTLQLFVGDECLWTQILEDPKTNMPLNKTVLVRAKAGQTLKASVTKKTFFWFDNVKKRMFVVEPKVRGLWWHGQVTVLAVKNEESVVVGSYTWVAADSVVSGAWCLKSTEKKDRMDECPVIIADFKPVALPGAQSTMVSGVRSWQMVGRHLWKRPEQMWPRRTRPISMAQRQHLLMWHWLMWRPACLLVLSLRFLLLEPHRHPPRRPTSPRSVRRMTASTSLTRSVKLVLWGWVDTRHTRACCTRQPLQTWQRQAVCLHLWPRKLATSTLWTSMPWWLGFWWTWGCLSGSHNLLKSTWPSASCHKVFNWMVKLLSMA